MLVCLRVSRLVLFTELASVLASVSDSPTHTKARFPPTPQARPATPRELTPGTGPDALMRSFPGAVSPEARLFLPEQESHVAANSAKHSSESLFFECLAWRTAAISRIILLLGGL